ncbi:MAG TPA: FkbM family methyltransferase, partial [Acidocella sp.]|nr:FkbM family methyltransferase [Acidocella sp.]
MRQTINHFTMLESVYGKYILNRHCAYQADFLVKTGYPHIEQELTKILTIVNTLPEGCVVVDAGANIGLVSIPVAQEIKARGGVAQDFGLYSLTAPASGAQEEVALTAIDELDLPGLDFLKIDVEGMEPDVLRGARRAIHEFRPWCWVEYWKVDIHAIKAAFAGQDYRFFPMDRLNLLCAPAERLAQS